MLPWCELVAAAGLLFFCISPDGVVERFLRMKRGVACFTPGEDDMLQFCFEFIYLL